MNNTHADIIVKNGTVVTSDKDQAVIEDGVIVIRKGVIESVQPLHEDLQFTADMVIDACGGLIMPGLVNAHTHLPMSLFRGLADDMELMTWLNEVVFPAEATYINPESVKTGSLLSCAEMLLSGTTTCCDGYFYENHIAEAIIEAGMRGVTAQGVIDFPAPGVADPTENIHRAMEFVCEWKNRNSLISPSVFCHSLYTCSPGTLVTAKMVARENGALFQIHLAETAVESQQIREKHGMTPTEFIDSLGILDKDTLLHHVVWADEADMEIIRASGASVSHNPQSNMKLASGVSPVPHMVESGIPVGLGTDGSASNNTLDMFSEMATAARLHKVYASDPVAMPAQTVLDMATATGARAIGLGDITGSLEAGKKADLIILDTDKPHLVPMYSPVSNSVYAASGSDVRDVIIDGNCVVRNREILTFDLREILDRVKSFGETVRVYR